MYIISSLWIPDDGEFKRCVCVCLSVYYLRAGDSIQKEGGVVKAQINMPGVCDFGKMECQHSDSLFLERRWGCFHN